eukprot:762853-Hanusia_phi.AAC.9
MELSTLSAQGDASGNEAFCKVRSHGNSNNEARVQVETAHLVSLVCDGRCAVLGMTVLEERRGISATVSSKDGLVQEPSGQENSPRDW